MGFMNLLTNLTGVPADIKKFPTINMKYNTRSTQT